MYKYDSFSAPLNIHIVTCLKFFTLVTTLLLAAAVVIVRSDVQDDDYKLHKLLEKALLTESNIYAMQQVLYPSYSFEVSEVHFNVTVQVEDFSYDNKNKWYFKFDHECHCYKWNDLIRVMTNSMTLQIYIEGFMPYLRNFTDYSFFTLLSKLTKAQSDYVPTKLLWLNLTEEVPSESHYNDGLLALFSRVSYTLNKT